MISLSIILITMIISIIRLSHSVTRSLTSHVFLTFQVAIMGRPWGQPFPKRVIGVYLKDAGSFDCVAVKELEIKVP